MNSVIELIENPKDTIEMKTRDNSKGHFSCQENWDKPTVPKCKQKAIVFFDKSTKKTHNIDCKNFDLTQVRSYCYQHCKNRMS